MLTTGEFSSTTRLTVKALRLYHEEGLLVPEKIDAVTGYRYYGDESFRKANAIILLRELGFSISEMKTILSSCKDEDELVGFFTDKLRDIEKEMLRIRDARNRINYFIESGKADIMKNDFEIYERDVDDVLICGIRFFGKYPEIGSRFGELMKKAGRYISGKTFALYYDGEYKDSDTDIEAAVEVRKEIDVPGVSSRKLEGGHCACIVHRGSYDQLGVAYKALFDYMKDHGLRLSGPVREIYHKGPGWIIPRDPKRFVTEIMFPAEKS